MAVGCARQDALTIRAHVPQQEGGRKALGDLEHCLSCDPFLWVQFPSLFLLLP